MAGLFGHLAARDQVAERMLEFAAGVDGAAGEPLAVLFGES